MKNYINLASVIKDSVVDGPGIRTVIFVQGCDHHCPGCHNPETQGIGGYLISAKDLAKEISKEHQPGEMLRITLSGGEPMLQARGLTMMLQELESKGFKLDIWCYTGHTFEGLIDKGDTDQMRLLRRCDVLIDGPYIEALRDTGLLFRGSSNQRLIDLGASLIRPYTVVEWRDKR